MTAPKFRYLIITEDDEVYGTNDETVAESYAEDLCSVLDVQEGILWFDMMHPEGKEEIEEAMLREAGGDETDDRDRPV